MNKTISCSIIQDLLPNYIEKLTSSETNSVIEEHLESCEACREVYEQMAAEFGSFEKVPTIELKFLKKIKRTRLLAATLCIVLTLVLSCLIYDSEFHYTIDKDVLSIAITDYISPFESIDAYALETKEMDGMLFVSFKDRLNPNMYGVARFSKGINRKYRIIGAQRGLSEFSSVVDFYRVKIKDEQYVAVSGYNLSEEIKYYGLNYGTYSLPGERSDNRVMRAVKFEVENPQFLTLYSMEELDNQLLELSDEPLERYILFDTTLYDDEGVDITENYRVLEKNAGSSKSSTSTAEQFMLYVYIGIVVWLGVILTRYFLI